MATTSIQLKAITAVSSQDTSLEENVNEELAFQTEGVKLTLVYIPELNEDDWCGSIDQVKGKRNLAEFSPLGTYWRLCTLGGGACRIMMRPTNATVIPHLPQLQPSVPT